MPGGAGTRRQAGRVSQARQDSQRLAVGPIWPQLLMHSVAKIDRVQDRQPAAVCINEATSWPLSRSEAILHELEFRACGISQRGPRAALKGPGIVSVMRPGGGQRSGRSCGPTLRITRHYAWDRSGLPSRPASSRGSGCAGRAPRAGPAIRQHIHSGGSSCVSLQFTDASIRVTASSTDTCRLRVVWHQSQRRRIARQEKMGCHTRYEASRTDHRRSAHLHHILPSHGAAPDDPVVQID